MPVASSAPVAPASLHPPSPGILFGRRRRRPGRIEVRRFAGHLDHAERLVRPLTVAHVTDQHVGRVTPIQVQWEAVRLINAARPDLVVLTGDFVCYGDAYLEAVEELVGAVCAPVFAVLGNHDHWAGAARVERALGRAGAEVLRNAHTSIRLLGQRLQVVGLDDAYTGHADSSLALAGLDPELPSIGLSHIPEEADRLWAGGVPLVFAGHTHAGQVTWGGLNELTLGRRHRYVHGLYGARDNGTPGGAVYVGAGIGAAMMPVRLGDRGRREVAIFELGAEPGTVEEHHAEQAPLPGRRSPRRRTRRSRLPI